MYLSYLCYLYTVLHDRCTLIYLPINLLMDIYFILNLLLCIINNTKTNKPPCVGMFVRKADVKHNSHTWEPFSIVCKQGKKDKNIKIHLIFSRVYLYFIPIIRRVIFLVQIQTVIYNKGEERQTKKLMFRKTVPNKRVGKNEDHNTTGYTQSLAFTQRIQFCSPEKNYSLKTYKVCLFLLKSC